ncbi:hypothetical protein NP233_g1611 [Leucocoprinus birnbaumii]|uniref:Uncharacterized protein n=1 Tax=Leucocoprinus birnbaumii TaxID=56174 RepID=A0AAD5YZI8_9AGAR|nr:hypothetical protein NP233_g1611 [Leucocoprinus birnbaumii]
MELRQDFSTNLKFRHNSGINVFDPNFDFRPGRILHSDCYIKTDFNVKLDTYFKPFSPFNPNFNPGIKSNARTDQNLNFDINFGPDSYSYSDYSSSREER